MIQTDAELYVHRTYVELRPGLTRCEEEVEWKGGNVAFVSSLARSEWRRSAPSVGDVVDYGGVRALCFLSRPEWADGFYLVRLRGVWTWFYLVKHHIRRWLWWPKRIAFRLAWAVYLLDDDEGNIVTWHCLKPYKWARRVWTERFER